jgi:hypothetical protein
MYFNLLKKHNHKSKKNSEVVIKLQVRFTFVEGNVIAVIFQSGFMPKCIKIIFFLFFKKLFLRSAHQNDLKHIKKLIFHKKN